jgi:integrase
MAIRKTKTKHGRTRYAARVHLGSGKYRLLTPRPTERAAKEDEANWILSRERTERTRASEFVDFYLEGLEERVTRRELKRSSFDQARGSLRCFCEGFKGRSMAAIEDVEAEEWARLNRWAVPAVVTMFNYAVKKRVVDRNPFSGLSRKGPGRKDNPPLTVADVDKLAQVAEEEHGKGIAAFVRFTAYSGMRVGEVFALQWPDIDFKANRIKVNRRLYRGELDLPKANKKRQVVLVPEARDALLVLDRSSEWVFQGKRGGQLSQSVLTYYWQKIETGFGRRVQPHELKHFCGHYLYVTLGLPDRVVAVQLGHSDGGKLVRELYGHGDVGALDEIDRATRGRQTDAAPEADEADVLPFRRKADGG